VSDPEAFTSEIANAQKAEPRRAGITQALFPACLHFGDKCIPLPPLSYKTILGKGMASPNKHIRVGITGGIGAGKSLITKLFQVLGVPVYYADERAKYLMNISPELRRGIIRLFGTKAYGPDGRINRPYLAKKAFSDPDKLKALEALVHPVVFQDTESWEEKHKNVPYTLREAALLFESGNYKKLDKIITVTAPEEIRIQRILQRDKVPREAVLARIRRQWPEEEKVKRSDFVIVNDNKHLLIPQVLAIHEQLLKEATEDLAEHLLPKGKK